MSNQKSKILNRLKQGSCTNLELNEICFRYSARIAELRKAGHEISKSRVSKSIYKYILGNNKVSTLIDSQNKRLEREKEEKDNKPSTLF